MKKIALLFTLLLFLTGLRAQNTLMNGDFEIWSYGKPVNWTVGLHGTITSVINIPVEVNFGSQSSDVHSGNSAVKLQSADFTIPYTGYSFNLPGILQAGESQGFSIPLEDLMNIIQIFQDTTGIGNLDSTDLSSLASLSKMLSPGVPCTSTPHAVSAWVKYLPQEGDQFMILAMTKQNGAVVDYASKQFSANNNTGYQNVGVAFENPGTPCDSIMIIVMSALGMNSSSVLYVDDISLVYSGVGLESHPEFAENVYPNPASDVLYIEVESGEIYQWSLFDLTGRTLKSGKGQGKTAVNVNSYPAGIYMLTINVGDQKQTRKVVIR